MTNYLILFGSWWVVDGSGVYKKIREGDTTTLRADYVSSLAGAIQAQGSGAETVLTVLDQTDLDLDDADTWTAAVEDGFEFVNDGDVELIAYFDGTGGGERNVIIEGNPGSDLTLTLTSGQEQRSGRLSTGRFGLLTLVHFDAHEGVYVVAVDKGSV